MLTALILAAVLQSATVTGRVTDAETGGAVAGAIVSLGDPAAVVRTDSAGMFTFASARTGRHPITVRALGYRTAHDTVSVSAPSVHLEIALARSPHALPSIVVRAAPTAESERERAAAYGPPPLAVRGEVLRIVPGLAHADVLRSVQFLPGVAASSDYSSAPLVRGGSADQTLVTLDGVTLFNPYRFGGFFAAINPAVVEDATIHVGAMPASMGDRLSGVVSLRSRHSPRDRVRAGGSLGMIGTTADVEVPLFDGQGDLLFATRYHYVGRLVGRGTGTHHDAYDVFARLTRDFGPSESVSAWLLHDRETITRRTLGLSRWGSTVATAAYTNADAAGLEVRVRGTTSGFTGLFDISDDQATEVLRSRVHGLQLAGSATRRQGSHAVTVGTQLDQVHRRQDVGSRLAPSRDPSLPTLYLLAPWRERGTSLDAALYVEDEWQASRWLGTRVGVRVLRAGGLATAVLPRGAVRVSVAEDVGLTLGGGRYAQPFQTLHDDESVFGNLLTADLPTRSSGGLARGDDAVAAITWRRGGAHLAAETFMKWQRELWLRDHRLTQISPTIHGTREAGSATVRGIELSGGIEWPRFGVAANYSLSRARRRSGPLEYVPRTHRVHEADALMLLRSSRGTLLTIRTMLASGQPYTPGVGMSLPLVYDADAGIFRPAGDPAVLLGEHNSARTRQYFRTDVALRREYRPRWGSPGMAITPFLQVLNITNTRNEVMRVPMIETERPERFSVPQLPILPTVGLEWRF